MKWISLACLFALASGCSSQPSHCDDATECVLSGVIHGVTWLTEKEKAPQRCEDMKGESKDACDAQVQAIKGSISRAQSKNGN
ncbi:hypothetical protein [Shewanella sp.]|uniref:hypothetical protein n=1 Tax=Shewanella sp. TaxID=50422 RepID=UPI00405406AC